MIAFFSGDFQLETTFERMGNRTLKIDHEKEEYLFYKAAHNRTSQKSYSDTTNAY